MILFADATQETFGQTYNYWGQFVNMLLSLGLIIVLIFVSVYFLKRLMRSRIHHLNKTTGIKILERRALTSKTSLYLIEVLGKGVVISDSPSGIQVVTEFPSDVNVEEKIEQLQEESSFERRLKSKHA